MASPFFIYFILFTFSSVILGFARYAILREGIPGHNSEWRSRKRINWIFNVGKVTGLFQGPEESDGRKVCSQTHRTGWCRRQPEIYRRMDRLVYLSPYEEMI
jgi:hypothetical protein